MLINLILLGLFGFFSFTDKGRRIFATKRCSWAVLGVSALVVLGSALALLSGVGGVGSLLMLGCWGYMGYQASERVKPMMGWKSLLRLK